MARNFVDYTRSVLKEYQNVCDDVLIISPECNGFVLCQGTRFSKDPKTSITINDLDEDLADWIINYRKSDKYRRPFDLIIMSRVFEHLPSREYDWYLYQLNTIIHPNGKLIITVPNMDAIISRLKDEFNRPFSNGQKIQKLHFELFSDGRDVWDFHKTYTSEDAMRYYLNFESLFTIEDVKHVIIDCHTVPAFLECHLVPTAKCDI